MNLGEKQMSEEMILRGQDYKIERVITPTKTFWKDVVRFSVTAP